MCIRDRVWAVIFSVLSFAIANLGLNAIIAWSQPVLMFLYPLAIVLILLTLTGRLFGNDRTVLRWTIGFTAAAAVFDFLRAMPEGALAALHLEGDVYKRQAIFRCSMRHCPMNPSSCC